MILDAEVIAGCDVKPNRPMPVSKGDRMLNYVIWAAARNACMDLWSRIRTCSGKSFGLLWLLVLPTAGKSWKMSTIQVIF